MRNLGRKLTHIGDTLAGDPHANRKFQEATVRDALEETEEKARQDIMQEALLPKGSIGAMSAGDLYVDPEELTISPDLQEILKAQELLGHHRARIAKAEERARIQALKEIQRAEWITQESKRRSVLTEQESGIRKTLFTGYEALLAARTGAEEASARTQIEHFIEKQHTLFEKIRRDALALHAELQTEDYELGPVNLIPECLSKDPEIEESITRSALQSLSQRRYAFFDTVHQRTLAAHTEQQRIGAEFDVTSLLPETAPEDEDEFDMASDEAIPLAAPGR